MSDTGKTILWIVVAIVVIAVIIRLFVSAGRRREAEARRFEAGELRARVEERLPVVQDTQDRASVTAVMAADARVEAERTAAEAEQKAAEARRLEEQARAHRAAAEAARVEQAGLAREADRVDPDISTDDEGYRVDDEGSRLPGQGPSRGVGFTAGAAGATPAAAFTHDDDDLDDDDLADAENPFAPPGAGTAPETAVEPAPAHHRGNEESRADEPRAEESRAADAGADDEDDADVEQTGVADAAPAAGALGTGTAGDQHPDERSMTVSDTPSTDTTDTTGTSSAAGTDDAFGSSATPQVADAEQPTEVVVPALADRDDLIAGGGTPDGDPGDHRGQPWATTPGAPGPGESEEPANEGVDVDMAPHSHASDETDEPDEAVGSEAQAPRRQEAEPAPDAASAAYPDEEDPSTGGTVGVATGADDGDGVGGNRGDGGGHSGAPEERSTGRRVSGFDEVVDGGFGIGSAAPLADGGQPLGHDVKGISQGKTFVGPGDAGYDDIEPDVWFYNEEAARRAGFRREGE